MTDIERDREAARDIREAVDTVEQFVERLIYAALGFLVTYLVASVFFASHNAVEPALLNAGVAYYTHEVTGKVIRAMYALLHPTAQKHVRSLATTCRIVKDASAEDSNNG